MQRNSNILLYDYRELYNKPRLYSAPEPTVEGISACCTHQSEGDGGEVGRKSHYHQSSGAGSESEHHAQQLHFTVACHWHGTTSERFVARTAYATDGIEADKQVHTQKSKEKQP